MIFFVSLFSVSFRPSTHRRRKAPARSSGSAGGSSLSVSAGQGMRGLVYGRDGSLTLAFSLAPFFVSASVSLRLFVFPVYLTRSPLAHIADTTRRFGGAKAISSDQYFRDDQKVSCPVSSHSCIIIIYKGDCSCCFLLSCWTT